MPTKKEEIASLEKIIRIQQNIIDDYKKEIEILKESFYEKVIKRFLKRVFR